MLRAQSFDYLKYIVKNKILSKISKVNKNLT